MLKAITFDELTKILYSKLILFSGLDRTQIRNADGLQGSNIEKLIDSTKIESLQINDSFIIFEIVESSDRLNIGEEDDDTISSIIEYKLIVRCYGWPSAILAQQILARFKTNDNLLELRSKGIYINNIITIDPIKEFINNIWWPRRDFTIKMLVRYSTQKVDPSSVFSEELSDISLYTS